MLSCFWSIQPPCLRCAVFTNTAHPVMNLLVQEVEFIWKAPGNLARICFLFYRYCTVFGLAVLVYCKCPRCLLFRTDLF